MIILSLSLGVLGVLGLSSRIKNKLLRKILSILAVLGICSYAIADILSLHWTDQHVKWAYVKTIFHPGFIRQSGITSATLATGVLILGTAFLAGGVIAAFLRIKKIKWHFVFILFASSFLTFYFSSPELEPDFYFAHMPDRESSGTWKVESRSKNPAQIPYVFLIVGEGMKSDLLTKEFMPQISELEGIIYPKNFSTANATHFALFTILTGLFPDFYRDAVDRNLKIPFLSWTKDLGYQSTAINSDLFSWMSLEQIISPNNFDNIIEIKKDDRSEGDRLVLERIKELVKSNKGAQFFFVKLNGTHHNYFYPKEFEYFKPVVPLNFNFLLNSPRDHIEPIKNRYLNSVRYFDFLVGDFVSFLKDQDIWNKSLVVITADHGEEFYEAGTFAHSTALNYYQTSAFLFIHKPEDKEKKISQIQSSHLDIVPTLVEILGGKKPKWMKGLDLNSSLIPRGRVVFSAWHNALEMGATSFNRDRLVFSELSQVIDENDRKLIDDGMPYYHQLLE